MTAPAAGVGMLLRSLKLPGFVRAYAETAGQAEREGWGFERYLGQLAEIEIEERRRRRIDRLLRAKYWCGPQQPGHRSPTRREIA